MVCRLPVWRFHIEYASITFLSDSDPIVANSWLCKCVTIQRGQGTEYLRTVAAEIYTGKFQVCGAEPILASLPKELKNQFSCHYRTIA